MNSGKMYAGVALILKSGSFIFLFDASPEYETITIVMFVISVMMILLLRIIRMTSLNRIKQWCLL
jgi:hypothetical protein